jgi:hypothetical protein
MNKSVRAYDFKINKGRERKGLKDKESARTSVTGISMGLLTVIRIILILSIEIRLCEMDAISATAQNTYGDEFVSVAILSVLIIKHMAFGFQSFCIYLFT